MHEIKLKVHCLRHISQFLLRKNEDIIIDGFSIEILRGDHPSGDKQGGVCVYFKENLPIKRRKDL